MGKADAASCAAAVLVGLNIATQEERQLYEGTSSRPPPVELPQLAYRARERVVLPDDPLNGPLPAMQRVAIGEGSQERQREPLGISR